MAVTAESAYVLMHSLLLGPLTWAPVAARLRAAGAETLVPSFLDVADGDPPFWPRVVATVDEAVSALPPDQPVLLVAHSNAGLFVPVVAAGCRRAVAGCLFVDARLPAPVGPTPAASPERLDTLRAMAIDGRLPPWTAWWDEDEVAALFPDAHSRATISAEQPRLPLSYYEQEVPAPAGWDDRPCGYLAFGPPYDLMARDARERGWDVAEIPGGHLHQVADPDAVAARIVAMTGRWRPPPG